MLVKKLFREKQFFEMNSFSREKGLDFIEVSNAFFFFLMEEGNFHGCSKLID